MEELTLTCGFASVCVFRRSFVRVVFPQNWSDTFEGSTPENRRRVVSTVIKIKSRGSESIDQMLRRFKKLCEKEGLTKDIKRNSYYEKPSERRRRKRRKALKRAQQESPT